MPRTHLVARSVVSLGRLTLGHCFLVRVKDGATLDLVLTPRFTQHLLTLIDSMRPYVLESPTSYTRIGRTIIDRAQFRLVPRKRIRIVQCFQIRFHYALHLRIPRRILIQQRHTVSILRQTWHPLAM